MSIGRVRAPSLVRRLMVGLSLASFSAAILMVALAGWRDLRTGEAELATTTDQAIAKLAKILERPLWDLDMERVGSIAEAFSQDPRVTRLTIREASGGKLHVMTRGDSSASFRARPKSRTFKVPAGVSRRFSGFRSR